MASVARWGNTAGVDVRKRPRNPLERQLNAMTGFIGRGGVQPSDRTQQYLRRNALMKKYREDPDFIIRKFAARNREQPDLEQLYILAELAYVQGQRAGIAGNQQRAGRMFCTSVIAAYRFLFESQLDIHRNAYDPLFRNVCDLYNGGLEGMMRIMRDDDALRPGGTFTATTLGGEMIRFTITLEGRPRGQFEKFEFVSDFDTEGLRNVYNSYGLGVPLIGVRGAALAGQPDERFYPPGLTMPLTAFLRVLPSESWEGAPSNRGTNNGTPSRSMRQCVIQLFDPLEQSDVQVNGRSAPLESDISTPLAYYLDDPLLGTNWFATAAMLNGEFAKQFRGLYMLEPYDPQKIPVVMVHGFWSSPMTWTEMFNDLRSSQYIRDNYQFWFYLYPTGQPFWFSARQMRIDLEHARQTLDPHRQSARLDQMVLVGHSMGGLISRLQTIDSQDRFWSLVSNGQIDQLQGQPETIQQLRSTLFFEANPSVSRVITLGTPHRGSNFANSVTRWIGNQFFRLPSNMTNEYRRLVDENPDGFTNPELLTISTSIDSLATDSPFFAALEDARPRPEVKFHNVIGVYKPQGVTKWIVNTDEPTDGVVQESSARSHEAVSEIVVSAEHSKIHQHPEAILEVRRILLAHANRLAAAGLNGDSPRDGNQVQQAGFRADEAKRAGTWKSTPDNRDPRYWR